MWATSSSWLLERVILATDKKTCELWFELGTNQHHQGTLLVIAPAAGTDSRCGGRLANYCKRLEKSLLKGS